MDIKTKILKILPYWLTSLIFVISLQSTPLLFSKPSIASALPEPQVLGESTSIRGEPLPENRALVKIKEPDVSAISAKSFLVFDFANGQNLLEKNAEKQLGIASLTKLMTGLVAYSQADLNKTFTITGLDILNISPSLGLMTGDTVQAIDVFNAMLVGSNNDAALALANFTAQETGQNFIRLMNDEAVALGMSNTHFSNALGFDSLYNYSTAEDLKTLIVETEKLAAFTNLGRRVSYNFSGSEKKYSTQTTNKLLNNHPDIQAIKTGYTQYSGGAMATKVKIGDHDIVIIVIGSQDREGDTLKLKEIAETNFK